MTTLEKLEMIKSETQKNAYLDDKRLGKRIVVGMATCGLAAGANPVYQEFERLLSESGLGDVKLCKTGCIGSCRLEPMVEVYTPEKGRVTYVHMTPDKVEKIFEQHIKGNKPVKEFTVGEAEKIKALSMDDVDFYKRQTRIALRNCGIINPEEINEYIARDGYKALSKVINEMKPTDVIDTLLASGLRGRGGAGFPTGLKWKFTMGEADQKYVVCNADEGDPGAFMDRSILEGDPHAVLEAMAIAGYTIGATMGYIYVRAEYPVAVERLGIAINQAKEIGVLGKNILGTGVDFDIELRLGAGAFICGEETALIASIEGERGEPRPKPPFPAQKGVFGKPTVINNVETLANISQIINKGAEWFASMGTERSKGTKVFALGGKINNTGLVEIPMGTTLREVLYDIGGGIPGGKEFKAAQTGGPSGGCIPTEHLDTPIDYDSLLAIGSMMGSGGLIVMDEDNCMVDIAHYFLDFTVDESCGKCTPCRIGTKRMLEILERLVKGKGQKGDIEKLEELGNNIKKTALCGLGQSAPNPVLSTLRYFKDEYVAHIEEKRCPAGSCRAMLNFTIMSDKCVGCGLCAKKCPVECISGHRKSPYLIDQEKCIKCGECHANCPFDAIIKK